MNGSEITLALTGPIFAIVGPLLLAHQINRARAAEKQVDWERQDRVAEKAAEAARQAQVSAKEIIQTSDKIHTLVNSNMGAQLKATAFFSRSNAVSLRRIAAMTKDKSDAELAKIAEEAAVEAESKSEDHARKQAIVDAAAGKPT